MTSRKAIARTSTDEDMIQSTSHDPTLEDCDAIDWVTPTNNQRIWPPEGTTSIAVDVHPEGGAIKIYETPRDKFVGGVGQNDSQSLVLLQWKPNWWFYSIGTVRVGYMYKKS